MPTCPTCATPLPQDGAACPHCDGTSEDTRLAAPENDVDRTRLAEPPSSRSSSGSSSQRSSSGGLLASSATIDHGRFPPGTLLGGRYRIVGRLGRGGMGEVFRADDLKLAQPVALKFCPPRWTATPRG